MKQCLFVALLLIVGAPSSVRAQSTGERIFVDGTVFASIERRDRTESTTVGSLGIDRNGTVPGGGFTVGTWLTPRVSVRLEMAFPGSVESTLEETIFFITGFDGAPATAAERIEVSERVRTAAALVAYHTERRHRVQLGYLAGVAFLFTTQRLNYSLAFAPTLFPLPAVDATTSTQYAMAAEVGADADIALAGRLSVVPQLRVFGSSDGLSVRPGVALRLRW